MNFYGTFITKGNLLIEYPERQETFISDDEWGFTGDRYMPLAELIKQDFIEEQNRKGKYMDKTYTKMESKIFEHDFFKNQNGRDYYVVKTYGERNALVQDKKNGEVIMVEGLAQYLVRNKGESFGTLTWIWDRTYAYYDDISQVNFPKIEERFAESEPELEMEQEAETKQETEEESYLRQQRGRVH